MTILFEASAETGNLLEVEISKLNGYLDVNPAPEHPIYTGRYAFHHWITDKWHDNPNPDDPYSGDPKRISRIHWKPWSLYGTGKSAEGGSAWIRHIFSRIYYYFEEEWPGCYGPGLQFNTHMKDGGADWLYTYVGWLIIRGGSITLDHTWKAGENTRAAGMSKGPSIVTPYNFERKKWYEIQFEANIGLNGQYRAWVNGELVCDTGVYGDLMGCGEIDRCWAGIQYTPIDPLIQYGMYSDDWLVADEYIQPPTKRLLNAISNLGNVPINIDGYIKQNVPVSVSLPEGGHVLSVPGEIIVD